MENVFEGLLAEVRRNTELYEKKAFIEEITEKILEASKKGKFFLEIDGQDKTIKIINYGLLKQLREAGFDVDSQELSTQISWA
ncbi:hypothetical protein DXP70_08180 [Listeria monocytogenes]|nr:hypothetical protein [Listeria monocytogenes]MCX67274.1 hypothetical protein [Listeria monocytogenes]MDB03037.1 hypothetical protein [Listeria monocytogenes]MDB35381.1 hypothetical protein [Listeria monocytogenes]